MKILFNNKKAEDNQLSSWIIVFIGTGLFMFCIYAFAVSLEDYYTYANMSINDERIDLTNLEVTLNDSNENANTWRNSYLQQDVSLLERSILFIGSMVGIIQNIFGVIGTFFDIFFKAGEQILGIPPVVSGVVLFVLIILLIFASWKVFKTGGWF